jgi:hypothetical protein
MGTAMKELKPTFTRGWKHIPQLRDKLPWLYGHHPFVKTQYQLAAELRVSPATLATWLNGQKFTDPKTVARANPDSIPIKHYQSFLAVWGLPAAVLEMDDTQEFQTALATFETGRGPWDKLVRALPDDETIEIILSTDRGVEPDPADADEAGIPHLWALDEIMLSVRNPGLRHAAILLQDRHGWSTLHPSPRWPETDAGEVLVWPRQPTEGPRRFRRLDMVGGVHRILVVFTHERLPDGVLDILLSQPMDMGSLNHVASTFLNRLAAGKCRMLMRRFLVSATPRPMREGAPSGEPQDSAGSRDPPAKTPRRPGRKA